MPEKQSTTQSASTTPPSPITNDPNSLVSEECYAFLCDHADKHAEMIREYVLYFYPKDNSVEMFDPKQRRKFIKRSKYPSLGLSALILGTSVTVFSRQLYLRDYADETTRSRMTTAVQQMYILVPEPYLNHLGSILCGFSKCQGIVKDLCLITNTCNLEDLPGLIKYGNKFAIAHIVTAAREVSTTKDTLESGLLQVQKCWPEVCQIENTEYTSLCLFEKHKDAKQIESEFMLSNKTSRSMMVIKPHAVLEGQVGQILNKVQTCGLQLRHIQTFVLARPDAEDFLEIYKGVIPEYSKMVDELISGPLIACEVYGTGDDVVKQLRTISGPYDPELGQVLFPSSIRAQFGHDKVKNAVHCTDLVEDAELEAMFFFQLVS